MPSAWPKPGDPDYQEGFVRDKIRRRSAVGFSKNATAKIAGQMLERLRIRKAGTDLGKLSLLDLVPATSQHLAVPLEKPEWLLPLVNVFEQAIAEGGVRGVMACPPQHGKSTIVQHALLRAALLGLDPDQKITKRHAYITYNADRAENVSRQFQQLAEAAGLEPDGKLGEVHLKGGTEVLFTSIGGSLTGFAVDGLMVIDDPHKDRIEAESPTLRLRVCDWFSDVARSRRHERTSILVIATRWHPEDLSGDRIRAGYPYINLKAIAEGPLDGEGRVANDPLNRFPGESLWRAKPPEFFTEEQGDPYTWASLYQGEPRGRGNTVFQWPDLEDKRRWYDPGTLPNRNRMRVCIGCDFAYTSKTYADSSVAVVLAQYNGNILVLDVVRSQEETRLFRARLEQLRMEWPDADFCGFVGAAERGGTDFIRDAGVPIRALSAQKAGDKFTRAIPVAAAWNTGRVLLPKTAPWLDTFLNEICSFTGVKDRHDDQVDALAGAFVGLGSDDELSIGTPRRTRGW